VADLTITSARVESGVMFLPPFMSSGSALLTLQALEKPSVWRFLRPFTARLWWFLLLAIIYMGITMWLQDRCSPFSHRQWAKDPQSRRTLNLPNASYITVMALLGKDAQEPRSVSSRLTFIGAEPLPAAAAAVHAIRGAYSDLLRPLLRWCPLQAASSSSSSFSSSTAPP